MSITIGTGWLEDMTMVFNKASVKGRRKQLRRTMPEAEVILWSQLKNKQLSGIKFRRQYSVGKYVVDFYCVKKKLAIEIDGDSHYTLHAPERDEERQQWIEQFGIRFLRFTNDDVRKNLYVFWMRSIMRFAAQNFNRQLDLSTPLSR